MSGAPPGIARFDSAAAMAQAIAAFLHGRDVASLSGSPLLDRTMPAVNLLPRRARELAYSIGGMTEAVGAGRIGRLSFDAISEWLAGLFPRRDYPAAFIGSSNGALAHLAAALGAPWLPQTFLCPVRCPWSDPDDVRTAFARGRRLTEAFLKALPTMTVHHMHDPNQDRLMLKTMGYFRLKHRALPAAYRDFLVRRLPPGATLYVDECTRAWPVTRTSERSVFQFGAVGGMEAEEYVRGGDRVRAYLARYRVRRTGWDPPEPNDVAPEAEWGFDPGLLAELSSLAATRGWRLVLLRFEDPEALSLLTAAIHRAWYRDLGYEPTRLIVESFVLLDPYRVLRLRALPLWLLFCVERSARVLQRFLDEGPPFDEIGLMLFSHGTEGVGVVGIEEWRRLLGRARRGRFLGVDEARYPRDFATFIRFHEALAELGTPFDLPPPLPPERFEALTRRRGPALGIEIAGPAGGSASPAAACGPPS
ncbi:hypothetical protein KXR53_22660 [Inquilinus limosus]|uniref:hypothetical protein n=1 Tax=Inquilinus limosus TaxID=171674 RepID=UPI003F15A893